MDPEAHGTFQAGRFRTIEAADAQVVGIPANGSPHMVLGTASSREEAVVIATILRVCGPA